MGLRWLICAVASFFLWHCGRDHSPLDLACARAKSFNNYQCPLVLVFVLVLLVLVIVLVLVLVLVLVFVLFLSCDLFFVYHFSNFGFKTILNIEN